MTAADTAPLSTQLMSLVFGQDATLNAHTNSISDWSELEATIRAVGGYNNFDPERVLNQLHPLFARVESVEVGRESSPVIYVNVPYWTHQQSTPTRPAGRDFGMGERIPLEERQALADCLFDAMRNAAADEISDERADQFGQVSSNPHRLRFWWD